MLGTSVKLINIASPSPVRLTLILAPNSAVLSCLPLTIGRIYGLADADDAIIAALGIGFVLHSGDLSLKSASLGFSANRLSHTLTYINQ